MDVVLIVQGPLDRETVADYQLWLTVSDLGNPSRTTNISFTIEILDENDHCPQLHIETTFMMVNRDITTEYFIVHLIATDKDEGSNGQITFGLPSSSPFIVLHPNGTLIVQTHSALIDDDSIVTLPVQIRDHGQPTSCLVVETLRLYVGSNRTDWPAVLHAHKKQDDNHEASSVTSSLASMVESVTCASVL